MTDRRHGSGKQPGKEPPGKEPPGKEPQEPKVRISDKRVRIDEPAQSSGREGAEAAQGTATAGDLDRISSELEEAAQLAADRLDQLMRLKADYENFRQRVIREQTELLERASIRVVEQLLPVVDNFERAIASAKEHDPASVVLKGVELVCRQLHDVLASEGLERLEAEGRPFDPHEHEAMASEASEVSEPTVLEVVRPGYRLKGRTIRAALVKVATPSGDCLPAEGDADPDQEER